MKRYFIKRSKINFLVLFLGIIILIMSIGYAIFEEQLNITGLISGNSRFKVYFIDAWIEDASRGTAIINTENGADRVTYNVTLNYPGDKVLIGTKIKNESTVPVKLNDFLITKNDENSDIKIRYISLDPNTEVMQENEICDYEFVVEWNENSSNVNPETVTCEISLDYEQFTEASTLESVHTHDDEIEEKEIQNETIEILGNDSLENDYTLYINEIRGFKALVKTTYTDNTEQIDENREITWTVTNVTGVVEQQSQTNILKGMQAGTVKLKAEFEKNDGTTGCDEKTINVINWQESNGTITNGEITLKVGDYVAYDNTTNYNGQVSKTYKAKAEKTGNTEDVDFSASEYTGGWRVLGISDGKIQLISAEPVGTLKLKSTTGYINGINELNSVSAIYGYGDGADSARCVSANDVNKITGYNPILTGTGEVRGKGKMWEYGNEVTYFWENNKVSCIASNGLSSDSTYTSCKYYDKENNIFVDLAKNKTFTQKSCSYYYYPTTLTESSSGTLNGIAKTSTEYKLLFNSNYWLDYRYVGTGAGYMAYGILQVNNSRVYDSNLFTSKLDVSEQNFGVRPVITMSEFLRIKNDSNDGSIQDKAYTIK